MKRSNEQWLDELKGPGREEALADLRKILIKGLTAAFAGRIPGDWEAALEDFCQDALIKILENLESFRGESHFTTWAQKIAVRVAYTELRRARWKDIPLQALLPDYPGDLTPAILADENANPAVSAEQREMLDLVLQLIQEVLSERQRTALVAVMVQGMPMEETARRLDTNRNAVYKLIYDARQKLKKGIEAQGLSPLEVLAVFGR